MATSTRRILLASYHFPPSSAMGAQRAERLARLLPEFGYEVSVICASLVPEEPSTNPTPNCPEQDGFSVRRVPTPFVLGRDPGNPPPPEDLLATAWWKLRAYAEYLFLTSDWSWNWAKAACRSLGPHIIRSGFEAMILDAPPNPSLVPFFRLAQSNNTPVVLDFRDWWDAPPDPVPWWNRVSPSQRRMEWERRLREEVVLSADHIILNTAPMKLAMREAFSMLPESTFSAITNAFGQVDDVPDLSPSRASEDHLKMAYTGSLAYGRDHQVGNLIRAMGETSGEGGSNVELIIAGKVRESLKSLAAREGVGNRVRFLGWISQEDAIKLQRDSEVLLLVQPDRCADVAVPGKLFEYMARRRNVLAMVGNGPAATLIREHDLGVVVNGESPQDIRSALANISERVRIRPFLPPPPECFSERSTVHEFAQILDRVLEGRRKS